MLFTLGYEGKIIDEFISLLKDNNISKVVDVRELPLSRKKGYSKTALSELLKENGIGYIHMKKLGSPKEIREKLKNGGDIISFFEDYRNYLKEQTETLHELYNVVIEGDCCLVCYEDLPRRCHRSEICHEIKNIDNNGLNLFQEENLLTK